MPMRLRRDKEGTCAEVSMQREVFRRGTLRGDDHHTERRARAAERRADRVAQERLRKARCSGAWPRFSLVRETQVARKACGT